MPKPAALWILPLFLAGLLAYAWMRGELGGAHPGRWQSPSTVVSLQLAALRQVDEPEPEAGFAIVFRFASPENQRKTGPLPRFSRLLRTGPYGALVNHREARLFAPIEQGARASVPVDVTSRSGQIYRYVFLLRKNTGEPCDGCWLTEGVVPPGAAGAAPEI
ncbi:MAG: hypothetical protein EPN60_03040 [Nevskiaceae bacterium]|nr:MAG: hypothetical protein EPO48_09465 [Nevskiaceae bacterium]TAM32865.1 MAG: hypothetical protein EPN60_03040 [Nevskiaceae bacterium]